MIILQIFYFPQFSYVINHNGFVILFATHLCKYIFYGFCIILSSKEIEFLLKFLLDLMLSSNFQSKNVYL